MHGQMIFIRTQGFGHHVRTQIRTADTDIDNIGNGFAGITFPFTRNNPFTEGFHFCQYIVYIRHHVFAVHQNRTVGTVAQSGVQYGAVFRAVDFFTFEHGFHRLR